MNQIKSDWSEGYEFYMNSLAAQTPADIQMLTEVSQEFRDGFGDAIIDSFFKEVLVITKRMPVTQQVDFLMLIGTFLEFTGA